MNRNRMSRTCYHFACLLAVGCCLSAAASLRAQPAGNYRAAPRQHRPTAAAQREFDNAYIDAFVDQAGYCDPCDCGVGIGCGDAVCCSSGNSRCYAGFEAVFVKPRFESNPAFTVMEADGATFESFTDREFAYDTDFSPRVFLGWQNREGVGVRASWWLFDEAAATASASPPANGFGAIIPPAFGSVDISSSIPTDTMTANSSLYLYAIDLEATREGEFCGWNVGVAGGVRYAFTEQTYLAELRSNTNTLRGQIDYTQSIEGFGPTISLSAYRPIACDAGVFTKARGSLLYGDSTSRLSAGEDLDLTDSFTTTRTTGRDDLISVGEIQLGFLWKSSGRRSYRPFLSVALEGQIWNGVGNSSSEEGSVGFFGFNTGAGLAW